MPSEPNTAQEIADYCHAECTRTPRALCEQHFASAILAAQAEATRPLVAALAAIEAHHGVGAPWRKVANGPLPSGRPDYDCYIVSDGDTPPLADDVSGPMADFLMIAYALAGGEP